MFQRLPRRLSPGLTYDVEARSTMNKATSHAPERSLDLRMEALRRAIEIRSLRAQLKRVL